MGSSRTGENGFYGWVNVAVASIMGVIGGFYMVSFSYLLPYLVDDFGWNRGMASLAATINMIAMGLCGPVSGYYIFKYGARRCMVCGNILGFAGFLLIYFHTRLWELFLGYGLLIGLAVGFGGMLASTTVINNWFVKNRGMALSIFLGSGGAAGMVMGPATMIMMDRAGWRPTMLAIAILVLLFAVILPGILIRNKPQDLGQLPDGPEKPGSANKAQSLPPKAAYKTPVDFTAAEAMRTRSMWLLTAYFCLNMMAMGALMTHMVAYLKEMGILAAVTGLAFSVLSATMALGQFSVGVIGRRFSMHAIAVGGEFLKLIGLGIVISTSSLPFVFAYMVFLGLGFGFAMTAIMNMFPNYYGISNYPQIMGTVRLFWAFIGGAGAPLAGFIRETTGSYLPAFRVALVIVAAGLACLIFAKAPVHPSLKEEAAAERVA